LVELGFSNFESFEGEFLSLVYPRSRCFIAVQTTNSDENYPYLEKYVYNPLPEHQTEQFLNFSFISNSAEIKNLQQFFGNTGRTSKKKYKNKDSFYTTKQFQNFMKSDGFARKFLFKFPKMMKIFIESGNGNFLGTLVNFIFDNYKRSVLKSSSTSRSIYFESDRKFEIPKSVIEAIKIYKEQNQKKLEFEGYQDMNNRRIIGNHSIKTRIFKDKLTEKCTMFNHLLTMLFNMEVRNLSIDLDYGVLSHAIEVFSSSSFNK
jgi:hypothetical protein